jgi:hypothetical protein
VLDQLGYGHDLAGTQQQRGEHHAVLRRGYRYLPPVDRHPHGTENAELHL